MKHRKQKEVVSLLSEKRCCQRGFKISSFTKIFFFPHFLINLLRQPSSLGELFLASSLRETQVFWIIWNRKRQNYISRIFNFREILLLLLFCFFFLSPPPKTLLEKNAFAMAPMPLINARAPSL